MKFRCWATGRPQRGQIDHWFKVLHWKSVQIIHPTSGQVVEILALVTADDQQEARREGWWWGGQERREKGRLSWSRWELGCTDWGSRRSLPAPVWTILNRLWVPVWTGQRWEYRGPWGGGLSPPPAAQRATHFVPCATSLCNISPCTSLCTVHLTEHSKWEVNCDWQYSNRDDKFGKPFVIIVKWTCTVSENCTNVQLLQQLSNCRCWRWWNETQTMVAYL